MSYYDDELIGNMNLDRRQTGGRTDWLTGDMFGICSGNRRFLPRADLSHSSAGWRAPNFITTVRYAFRSVMQLAEEERRGRTAIALHPNDYCGSLISPPCAVINQGPRLMESMEIFSVRTVMGSCCHVLKRGLLALKFMFTQMTRKLHWASAVYI